MSTPIRTFEQARENSGVFGHVVVHPFKLLHLMLFAGSRVYCGGGWSKSSCRVEAIVEPEIASQVSEEPSKQSLVVRFLLSS